MRLLVLALFLACAVLLVLLVAGGTRTVSTRARARARWAAANVGEAGETVVVVQLATRRGRVLESRAVARLSDLDADYDAKLLEAMAQARSRAAVLNLELP